MSDRIRGRPRDTRFDRYMEELFQIGRNPYSVYNEINRTARLADIANYVSYGTVYTRYREWVDNGRKGELIKVRDGVYIEKDKSRSLLGIMKNETI